MKNTCIFSVFVFVASSYYAQNGSETRQVTTQSNGVIVYESAGNEGFIPVLTTSAVQQVRSIDEWTLAECIDALRVIDEKIEQTGTSEQERPSREAYFQQKMLIEKRKAALMTNQ